MYSTSLKFLFILDVELASAFLRDLRAALATFAVKIFNRQVRGGRPRSAQRQAVPRFAISRSHEACRFSEVLIHSLMSNCVWRFFAIFAQP